MHRCCWPFLMLAALVPGGCGSGKQNESSVATLVDLGAILVKDAEGRVTGVNLKTEKPTLAVENLSRLPHLQELNLTVTGQFIREGTLTPLRNLTALEKLHLQGMAAHDFGNVPLDRLSKLSQLTLKGGYQIWDKTALQNILKAKGLQELAISGGIIHKKDGSLEGFQNLKELKKLSLPSGVNDDGLLLISKMPALEHLAVGILHVSESGLAHLKNCRELRELHIKGGLSPERKVPDTGLENITDLPHLERLVVSGLKSDEMKHLSKCQALKSLDMGVVQPEADLAHLAKVPALEELTIRDMSLSDAGLALLAQVKGLRKLDIQGKRVFSYSCSAKGMADLRRKLPSCEILYDPTRIRN